MARTKYWDKETQAWEYADSGKRGSNSSTGSAVNVRNYGAKGDGVTDDTAAIAAAVAAVRVGGTLYFPAGTYRVSNINLKSNMTVQGDGWSSVIKLLDNTSDYHGRNNCLNIENIENVIVRDIKLDGNRPAQRSTAPSQDGRLDGLHIRYASDIYIENVWMYNNGYHGCIMTYATNVAFERCKATDNGFRPIHGHTQIYNCRLSNCVCENNGLGLEGGSGYENDSIFFFGAQDLVIEGNIIKSNRRGCITVGCDQASTPAEDIVPSRDVTISGNVCMCYEDLDYVPSGESDTGVAKFSSMGILVYGSHEYVLENVTITGNTIRNAHEAIRFYAQENVPCSINASVTGNTIIDCSYGVHAVEVQDIVISGNQFRNLAEMFVCATTVSNLLIQGNSAMAREINGSDMCQIKYDCTNVTIRGNQIIGSCENAVYASDSNKNVVVADNVLIGFATAEPVVNQAGHTSGNLIIASGGGDVTEYETIRISPYTESVYVRPNLTHMSPSTTCACTPVTPITDADERYELNTYISIENGVLPEDFDVSTQKYAIVFLSGTELGDVVGVVTLSDGAGNVVFSENNIPGDNSIWGVSLSITSDKVRELFPSATHVMAQTLGMYANPDSLANAYRNLNDGHAYVYRSK